MNDQTLKAARAYVARGLRVFPCNGKAPLTEHGLNDASTNLEQIARWFSESHNIGIAVPPGVVVVDVDPRNRGNHTLQGWCNVHGADWLADVPRSRTGRGDGGVHYWFRYDGHPLAKAIGGVDFIRGNKYVIAPPSVTNDAYRWEVRLPDDLADLPELPDWLLKLADKPEPLPRPEVTYNGADPLAAAAHRATTWPRLLEKHGWRIVNGDGISDGSRWRHPNTDNQFSATMRHDCLFVYSPNTPFPVTEDSDPRGVTLFSALETLEYRGDRKACVQALRDDGYLPTVEVGDVGDVLPKPGTLTPEAEHTMDAALVPGDTFIFEESADLDARWGRGHDVLWAAGESLMIVGPPGVGKTTLAHQIVAALLGLREDVLGYPVGPADRILYLAMDRPRQIRRAMRRIFKADDRTILNKRLIVHRGPLVSDLAKHPDMIVNLAERTGCDVVIVDSLKDAAIKLSDDETGGQVNRAIQLCNAVDIDVCVLHHQRKGQDGAKPTKLEDVYGSTWLTAGTGSVILLWGDAGGILVELIHLKQPADPVGPLNLEHNHIAGETTVVSGFNVEAFLRHRGPVGATVSEAAQAEHGKEVGAGSKQWKGTERRLRRLVNERKATHEPGSGVGIPGRYFTTDGDVGDLLGVS